MSNPSYIVTKVAAQTINGATFMPGTWKCTGQGLTGYGATPAAAQANWASQTKKSITG